MSIPVSESDMDKDQNSDEEIDDDTLPPFTPPKSSLMSKIKVMFVRDVITEKEKALGIQYEQMLLIYSPPLLFSD